MIRKLPQDEDIQKLSQSPLIRSVRWDLGNAMTSSEEPLRERKEKRRGLQQN